MQLHAQNRVKNIFDWTLCCSLNLVERINLKAQ